MSEYICGTDGHEGHWLTGEEIVRCRDCKALDQNDIDWRDRCYCRNFCEYVEPNGYCAWGERRNS